MSTIAPQAGAPASPEGVPPPSPGYWFRFWVRMLIAAVAFNIIAGLVTWFLIFPRIFPSH